jgi:hypothetical protein
MATSRDLPFFLSQSLLEFLDSVLSGGRLQGVVQKV